MSGLLGALLVGAAISLIAGAAGLVLASRLDAGSTGLWRFARALVLAPLPLAVLIFFLPTPIDVEPLHAPLDQAVFEAPLPAFDSTFPVQTGPAALPGEEAVSALAAAAQPLFASLYLAGLVLALGLAWRRHRARGALLAETCAADRSSRLELHELAEEFGVPAPELRISPRARSPFLTGWRPVLVAPERLAAHPAERRYALAHELMHCRRGDERDRLFGAALTCLLWFHWPLRRIEARLDEARELACDADCLRALGGAERAPYARALITLMRGEIQGGMGADTAPASAFTPANRRHREMRIKAILAGRSSRAPTLLAGASLFLLAGAGAAYAQTALTPRLAPAAPEARLAPVVTPLASVRAEAPGAPAPLVAAAPSSPEAAAIAPVVTPLASVRAEAPRAPAPPSPEAPEAAPLQQFEPLPEAAPAPAPDSIPSPEPVTLLADRVFISHDEKTIIASGRVGLERSDAAPAFSHRIADGRISSRFGHRPGRPANAPAHHRGVDIAASTGDPVWAPAAGVVTHAEMGFEGSERWGNTLVVDHGGGWSTVYAHLDGFEVEEGQVVRPGQQIARIGSTGASTGPHVHVGLREDGEWRDPSDHLPGLD